MIVVDLVQDERELLHGGDDDFLARADKAAQIPGIFRVPHGRPHLRELPDGVVDLPVQDDAVGYDDDRVKDRLAALFQADEPVRQPRNGVGLAAAGRVLDEIALPDAVLGDRGQ